MMSWSHVYAGSGLDQEGNYQEELAAGFSLLASNVRLVRRYARGPPATSGASDDGRSVRLRVHQLQQGDAFHVARR